MDILLRAARVLSLVFLSSAAVFGQQSGEIRGHIVDLQGEAVPKVSVTARGPALQGSRASLSDPNGDFRLPLLPVGTYALTFELAGFEKVTLTGNAVRLGFTSSLSIVLKPAAVTEEVTVVAENPLIDKVRVDTSYRLDSEDLAHVPTQARTIAEIVDLAPGVTGVRANSVTGGSAAFWGASETGLPSIRGEGDAGNNWLIDGLSSRGGSTNDPGVRLNYDAWEEVQIVTDGFAPQMGQALGGHISIVTKSGGNAFRGQAGALIQSRHLRAKRKEQISVVSLPETSLGQYFGNLGGPIIKDKLWFFASGNYFDSFDRSAGHSLEWLTVPAGERHIATGSLFAKATLTPVKDHTVAMSGMWDGFLRQRGGIGVPETYTRTDTGRSLYRLNYQGILSPSTLVTAALGQSRIEGVIEPLSGDYGPPSYSWLDIGQKTNNADVWSRTVERRTDLTAGLSHYWAAGRWGGHELKAGLSYFRNSSHGSARWTGRDADAWPGNGFDNGTFIIWSAPGAPLQLQEYGPAEMRVKTRGLGFYVEDNIVLGRFSVMAGLRADTQQVINDAGDRVWSWGPGDFLQPRISCSLDLSGDGKDILKFGYGTFAAPISLQSLSYFNTTFFYNTRFYGWAGPWDPTEGELRNPAFWTFDREMSGAATPSEVDPRLKPDTTRKVLLEFDRRLGRNWAVKVRGVLSWARDLLDDIALYAPENESEVRYLFTNFELKKRDYRALEIELNGRVRGLMTLNASYTWSQAKGTNPGNFIELDSWDSFWGGGYDAGTFGDRPYMPEGSVNKEVYDQIFAGLGGRGIGDEGWYGFLPYSVDHLAKISGTCSAPFGISIGARIEYLSGYHWEKKAFVEAYGGFLAFPEGRGGRTTPPHMYVDILIEKSFRLGQGLLLDLGLNAYNLMNSQRPVSFVKQDNSLFGQVWARQMPRWAQIKATLRF